MTSDGRSPDPRHVRRYRRVLWLAGAALWWERLWPRLWPAAVVAALFVAVVLLNLLPALPPWWHVLVLAAFAIAFALALWRAAPAFRGVDRNQARHRLETDSGLVHRPLAALEDQLAIGAEDPQAQALWQEHRRRSALAVGRLSVRPPAPGVARIEPWGIRAGALLLLCIGLAAGGNDAGSRFMQALTPNADLSLGAELAVEAWITPPPYTRTAPLFLANAAVPSASLADVAQATRTNPPGTPPDGPVQVPAGSTLLARVTGIGAPPRLAVGERLVPFQVIGDGGGARAFRVEAVIDAGDRLGDRLAVVSGRRTLASWPLTIIADRPPQVTIVSDGGATTDGYLRLGYEATDDYGIVAATLVIRPDVLAALDSASETNAPPVTGTTPLAGPDAELRLPCSIAAIEAKNTVGQCVHDVSAHPLAGQPVLVAIEAVDAAGQTGTSAAIAMIAPERSFAHPVARAVIALRKRLADASDAGPADPVRRQSAQALAAIAARPDHFAKDVVVSLALAVAVARLSLDEGADAVPSVRAILWETALRLDQGAVPVAERALNEARRRLSDALSRNADAAALDRLIDDLRAALDRYLAAVAAELVRRGDEAQAFGATAETVHPEALRELLDMARQLARTGNRESAQRILEELQRMLDEIHAGLARGGAGKELLEAQKLMSELRSLGKRQQGLLDETFQTLRELRARQERSGRRENGGTGESKAGDQEALRKDLGALMLRLEGFLGAIPMPLGEADRAMRQAGEALKGNRLGDAIPKQGQAVDALGRAAEAAGQAMARRLGAMLGARPEEEGGDGADPFGRSSVDGLRGFGFGDVTIPEQGEVRRAQEILNELRRRAGERHRPAAERDYIDRLLRQF